MAEAKPRPLGLIVLAGLMAVVAVLALAVAGRSAYTRLFGGRRDVPTIMVLTSDLVQNGIDANKQSDKDNLAALVPASSIEAAIKGGKTPADRQPGDDPHRPIFDSHSDRNAQLELLKASMADGIGLSVNDALNESHLFKPVTQAEVSGQLAQLHVSHDAKAGLAAGKIGGAARATADVEQAARDNAEAQMSDPSLAVMATNVGAAYLLTISVVEPDVQARLALGDRANPQIRLELTARPVIHFELTAVAKSGAGGFRMSKEIVLPNAIRREIPIAVPFIRLNYDADVQKVANDLMVEIHRKVAHAVVECVLDAVSPARLVAVGAAPGGEGGIQLTIDRGSSDGVRVGATYPVVREVGNDLTGDGVDGASRDVGKQRTDVGTITVSSVDTLKSYAIAHTDGLFQRGDIVVMTGTGGGGGSAAADVPLGTRELSTAKGAAGAARVTLAVDDIVVNAGGHSGDSDQLGQLISDALARDPRITVIPRAQMQDVLGERGLNAQSAGDDAGGGIQGMTTSNYLVSGSFSATTSRHTHATAISVAGVSEPLSRSTTVTTAVSGTLRVTSTSGVLKFSASVSGSSPQAVAEAAAQQLLLQIFPMQVIEVSGATVVVDRGQDTGMRVGARLTLYHVGRPLVDRLTGAVHEPVRTAFGQAVVATVQPTISTAAITTGAGAQEGDVAIVASAAGAGAAAGAARSPAPAHGGDGAAHGGGGAAHRAAARGRARAAAPAPDDGLHF